MIDFDWSGILEIHFTWYKVAPSKNRFTFGDYAGTNLTAKSDLKQKQ